MGCAKLLNFYYFLDALLSSLEMTMSVTDGYLFMCQISKIYQMYISCYIFEYDMMTMLIADENIGVISAATAHQVEI